MNFALELHANTGIGVVSFIKTGFLKEVLKNYCKNY